MTLKTIGTTDVYGDRLYKPDGTENTVDDSEFEVIADDAGAIKWLQANQTDWTTTPHAFAGAYVADLGHVMDGFATPTPPGAAKSVTVRGYHNDAAGDGSNVRQPFFSEKFLVQTNDIDATKAVSDAIRATDVPAIQQNVDDEAAATRTLVQTETNALDSAVADVDSDVAALRTAMQDQASAENLAAADAVWDEALTGATHNVPTSAGRRLREVSGNIVRSATAQGGTANTITLDAGASAVDDTYDPGLVFIESGTGQGQARRIIEYEGSTKTAVVDKDWRVNPDATSVFVILADPGETSTNEGLLRAATVTTAQLNERASSVDEMYEGQTIYIGSGAGQDQSRVISTYDGATKTITIVEPWEIIPDTTSGYYILPVGRVETVRFSQNAKDQINAEADTALADYDSPTRTEMDQFEGRMQAEHDATQQSISDLSTTTTTQANENETKLDAIIATLSAQLGIDEPGGLEGDVHAKLGTIHALLQEVENQVQSPEESEGLFPR